MSINSAGINLTGRNNLLCATQIKLNHSGVEGEMFRSVFPEEFKHFNFSRGRIEWHTVGTCNFRFIYREQTFFVKRTVLVNSPGTLPLDYVCSTWRRQIFKGSLICLFRKTKLGRFTRTTVLNWACHIII